MEKTVIDKIAFEGDVKNYHFKATYLIEPKGQALIQITKDGKMIKEFLLPAYKVFNIAAHSYDIVAGLEKENDSGLLIAGSDGLGGNSYDPVNNT